MTPIHIVTVGFFALVLLLASVVGLRTLRRSRRRVNDALRRRSVTNRNGVWLTPHGEVQYPRSRR